MHSKLFNSITLAPFFKSQFVKHFLSFLLLLWTTVSVAQYNTKCHVWFKNSTDSVLGVTIPRANLLFVIPRKSTTPSYFVLANFLIRESYKLYIKKEEGQIGSEEFNLKVPLSDKYWPAGDYEVEFKFVGSNDWRKGGWRVTVAPKTK